MLLDKSVKALIGGCFCAMTIQLDVPNEGQSRCGLFGILQREETVEGLMMNLGRLLLKVVIWYHARAPSCCRVHTMSVPQAGAIYQDLF